MTKTVVSEIFFCLSSTMLFKSSTGVRLLRFEYFNFGYDLDMQFLSKHNAANLCIKQRYLVAAQVLPN